MERFQINGKGILELSSKEALKEAFMMFVSDALCDEDFSQLHERLVKEEDLQTIYDEAIKETARDQILLENIVLALDRPAAANHPPISWTSETSLDYAKDKAGVPKGWTVIACLASLLLGFTLHGMLPPGQGTSSSHIARNPTGSAADPDAMQNDPFYDIFVKGDDTTEKQLVLAGIEVEDTFRKTIALFDFGVSFRRSDASELSPKPLSPTPIDREELWINCFEGQIPAERNFSDKVIKVAIDKLDLFYEERQTRDLDVKDVKELKSAINTILAAVVTREDKNSLYQYRISLMKAFVVAAGLFVDTRRDQEGTQIIAATLWGLAETSEKMGKSMQNLHQRVYWYYYTLAALCPASEEYTTVQNKLKESLSPFTDRLKIHETRIDAIRHQLETKSADQPKSGR